jgi:hypothetical protein
MLSTRTSSADSYPVFGFTIDKSPLHRRYMSRPEQGTRIVAPSHASPQLPALPWGSARGDDSHTTNRSVRLHFEFMSSCRAHSPQCSPCSKVRKLAQFVSLDAPSPRDDSWPRLSRLYTIGDVKNPLLYAPTANGTPPRCAALDDSLDSLHAFAAIVSRLVTKPCW